MRIIHLLLSKHAYNTMVGSQDTIVALRSAGEMLIIANVDKEKYTEISFDLDPHQVRDRQLSTTRQGQSMDVQCALRPT